MCDTQFTLILFFVFFWTNVQSKRTTRAEPEDHLWSADHSLRNAGITTTGPFIQQGNTILTRQYTAPYNTYTLSCPAVPIVSAEDSTTYDLLLSTRDELATFSFPFATAFDATHKPSSIVTISARVWCHTNHAIVTMVTSIVTATTQVWLSHKPGPLYEYPGKCSPSNDQKNTTSSFISNFKPVLTLRAR